MENVEKAWAAIFNSPIFNTLAVILIALIAYAIVHRIIKRAEHSNRAESMSRRGKTYMKLINSIVRSVFLVITILIILQVNGVNISSILAGVGIIGVVIGLAVQDTFKDIIRGLTIIMDGYFAVGDVVKLSDGTEAKVTSVGIRTTKLKSITDGCVISLSNRNIDSAKILPNSSSITLSLPYEVSIERAEAVIDIICKKIADVEEVDEVIYRGVKEMTASSVDYLISMKCKSEARSRVRRAANRIALQELAKQKISVPYQQIDIHNK